MAEYIGGTKRKPFYVNASIPAKRCIIEAPITHECYGQDASYPPELSRLIRPLHCNVCKCSMNSIQTAKEHYESRVHDRGLTLWLQMNYINKKLEPPNIKRFYRVGQGEGNISNSEALYCRKCDLKLTSIVTAQSHYAGRKHRNVIEKLTSPSGAGYYDQDGDWVRTATKVNPKVDKDGRFGIGEAFKTLATTPVAAESAGEENKKVSGTEIINFEESTTKEKEKGKTDKFICAVCNIFVTSVAAMKTHEQGAKHRRRLLANAVDPNKNNPIADSVENSILGGLFTTEGTETPDWSMYRTPTGSFYCHTCNLTLSTELILKQHLAGKKHLKRSMRDNQEIKPV